MTCVKRALFRVMNHPWETLSETLPSGSASASGSRADSESAESDTDSDLNNDLESEEGRSSESTASILTQLRCPSASRLARKRNIKTNSPPIGEKEERDMLQLT